MDIVNHYSKQIISRYFNGDISNVQRIKDAVNNVLWDLRQDKDRILFLNKILDAANTDYNKHLEFCKDKEKCQDSQDYALSIHFLQNELFDLGITIDGNTFTVEEREAEDSKLDKILEEINKLNLGQELLYNEMMAELEELRELYFLGKKNWYQLLAGKAVEMTASGVVGSTVSQKIIENFNTKIPSLLSNI